MLKLVKSFPVPRGPEDAGTSPDHTLALVMETQSHPDLKCNYSRACILNRGDITPRAKIGSWGEKSEILAIVMVCGPLKLNSTKQNLIP